MGSGLDMSIERWSVGMKRMGMKMKRNEMEIAMHEREDD